MKFTIPREIIFLEVAGYRLKVDVPKELLCWFEDSYSGFLVGAKGGNPEVEVRIDLSFKVNLTQIPQGCSFKRPFLVMADNCSLGSWHTDTRKAFLSLESKNPEGKFSLVNFLRLIFSYLVIREKRGALLHAAAVAKDNRGLVFVGPSGAGKTTIARLAKGYTVLDDELVLLKRVRKDFFIFPLPAAGAKPNFTSAKNQPYLLQAIFFLVQDRSLSIKELTKAQALAKIYSLPAIATESSLQEGIFSFFTSLVERVSCYDLHFLPVRGVWKCIANTLRQGVKIG